MAEATLTGADPTAQAAAPARRAGRLRSLPRETVLMLVLPPILVTLVFLGYVWWRQTATLAIN